MIYAIQILELICKALPKYTTRMLLMGFNEANPSKEKRKEKTKKIYKKAKAICQ